MKLQECELKKALKKFDVILQDLPDDGRFLHHYKSFIINFLRVKTKAVTLPTAEVMAVLKYRKPIIFSLLKKEYANNLAIHIVTNINLDYEDGHTRLSEIKKRLT